MSNLSLAQRVCYGLAGYLQHSHAAEMYPAVKEFVLQAELYRLVSAHFQGSAVSVNARPSRWKDRGGSELVDIAVPEHREWKAFIELKWFPTATGTDQARIDVLQDAARLASCTRSVGGRCERLLVVCFSHAALEVFPIKNNTVMRPVFENLLMDAGGPKEGRVSYQTLQLANKKWQDRTPHGVKVPITSGIRTTLAAHENFAEASGGNSGLVVVWAINRL